MKLFLFIFTSFSIFFTSCATNSPKATIKEQIAKQSDSALLSLVESKETDFNEDWVYLSNDACYMSATDKISGATFHAVKIQLNSGVKIISSTPSAKNPDFFNAQSTRDFAKENNLKVAINATPYTYPKGRLTKLRKLAGLYIQNGEQISVCASRYGAILFMEDENNSLYAQIIDSQKKEFIGINTSYAFGGFWTILKDGVVMDFEEILDARTAIGICNNGKTIILLTVDNPLPGNSIGASFETTAKIIKKIGAENALMLDGGSSTALIVNGKQLSTSFMQVPPALNFGFILP